MDTSEKIRNARIAAGITQEELAQRLGITQQALWQWEHGERIPRKNTLEKIAAALHVDVDALQPGSNGFTPSDYKRLCELEAALGELKETLSSITSRQETHGLTDEAQKVVDAYENMNAAGREALLQYAAFLALNPKYQKPKTIDKFKKIVGDGSEVTVEE